MAEGALKWLLWVGFAAGIAVVAGALFAIDFSHFFGIKQAFWGQGEEHTKQLHIRGLYKYSRHPIMLGVLITLWCVPSMSITKLNLSILMTIYMFIGLHFEEKALIKHFGDEYRRYQKQVGRIISFPWGKK